MKKLTIILLLFVSITAFSQKSKSYLASNGIEYQIGDTIQLGHGSAQNGDFQYLQMGGWLAVADYEMGQDVDKLNIDKHHSGFIVIIKKIKAMKSMGVKKTYFVVKAGNITSFNLYIEDAIKFKEVIK